MELVGQSQSTFGDMLIELGLASAMRPETEYTLLAPHNVAFNGEQTCLNAYHGFAFITCFYLTSCLFWLTSSLL